MRLGVRLGVDVGKARVGVARSDATGTLAVPVETVPRHPEDSALARLSALVGEYEALEVIVGLPLNLRAERTPSTDDAVGFAERLSALVPVPVRLVDERLSTTAASRSLHASGIASRNQRRIIDQQAAVVILQHALELERANAQPPGTDIVSRKGVADD